MTRRSLTLFGAAATAILLSAAPALAHHSYAMFDDNKVVAVDATVKEWEFTNPHTWLTISVMENGKAVDYGIEGSTTNSLLRRGWTAKTFKPGDKIKLEYNPLRDGRHGGAFVKATLADGTILTQFRSDASRGRN